MKRATVRLTRSIILTVAAALFCGRATNASIVEFITDRAAFEARLITATLIDFEGIVPDDETTVNPATLVETIGGVTFSVPVHVSAIAVSGKNGEFMQDAPFDSALLFSNASGGPITAVLPSDGVEYTAIGGFFGNIHRAGVMSNLTLVGDDGVLDSRTLVTADMGEGTDSNFFGWIVSGDSIISITHDLEGGSADFTGVDDFIFGIANTHAPVVPEPSTIAIWSLLGLVGAGVQRRRRQRADQRDLLVTDSL